MPNIVNMIQQLVTCIVFIVIVNHSFRSTSDEYIGYKSPFTVSKW